MYKVKLNVQGVCFAGLQASVTSVTATAAATMITNRRQEVRVPAPSLWLSGSGTTGDPRPAELADCQACLTVLE